LRFASAEPLKFYAPNVLTKTGGFCGAAEGHLLALFALREFAVLRISGDLELFE
jgi:hypothetical protein